MEYVIALDISMGKSYKVVYEDQICLAEGEVSHTQTGFNSLLEEIRNLSGNTVLVFESTGIYSKPVEAFCQKNQLHYCLLNPLAAKKQLEMATLRSWKTDKNDAHKLAQAHYLHSREEKVLQPDIYDQIRDLARFYQEVEEEIKRMRMYLHHALQLSFPELEQILLKQDYAICLNANRFVSTSRICFGFEPDQNKEFTIQKYHKEDLGKSRKTKSCSNHGLRQGILSCSISR